MDRDQLTICDDGDVDKIDANMKNGVLKITIPRAEAVDSEVRKININKG